MKAKWLLQSKYLNSKTIKINQDKWRQAILKQQRIHLQWSSICNKPIKKCKFKIEIFRMQRQIYTPKLESTISKIMIWIHSKNIIILLVLLFKMKVHLSHCHSFQNHKARKHLEITRILPVIWIQFASSHR